MFLHIYLVSTLNQKLQTFETKTYPSMNCELWVLELYVVWLNDFGVGIGAGIV